MVEQEADNRCSIISRSRVHISMCSHPRSDLPEENFAELGENISGPTKIWQDNQSTIRMANDFISNRKTKHIETKYHYTREKIENGEVKVEYLPSEEMLADILTKPVGANILQKMLPSIFGNDLNLKRSIKDQVEDHLYLSNGDPENEHTTTDGDASISTTRYYMVNKSQDAKP